MEELIEKCQYNAMYLCFILHENVLRTDPQKELNDF